MLILIKRYVKNIAMLKPYPTHVETYQNTITNLNVQLMARKGCVVLIGGIVYLFYSDIFLCFVLIFKDSSVNLIISTVS